MNNQMFHETQKKWMRTSFNVFQMSVKDIAERAKCSETTVRRILKEPVEVSETQKVMLMLKYHGISAEQLGVILDAPALTANNVANFLKKANPAQLAIVLTAAAGLTKTLPSTGMPTKPIAKGAQIPLFDVPE